MSSFLNKVIGYPTRAIGFVVAWPGNKLWELGARLTEGGHWTVALISLVPTASAPVTAPKQIAAPVPTAGIATSNGVPITGTSMAGVA